MRYYDELARYERMGFDVIVDKTWEDLDLRGQFEDSDLDEIVDKVNNGTYEWFMLRVRVMFEGHEMGSAYLGGCLYEDAREVLIDGTAEDLIDEALQNAKREVNNLAGKLWALQMEMDYADAQTS